MILYRPTDGDVHGAPIRWRPRTAFLMVQLGSPIPPIVAEIRSEVEALLAEASIDLIDADSLTTGRDFLQKIWELAISVPIGIAIVHEGIPAPTLANIFYEMGWMQAYGKETLVIRVGKVTIPSDFVRTEYVMYDGNFERRFSSFRDRMDDQAEHYRQMAELVENNPLLSIDYLRRAFLLSGDDGCRERAQRAFEEAGLEGRARNSVENLLVDF